MTLDVATAALPPEAVWRVAHATDPFRSHHNRTRS
jgi:hypothetical protein